MGSRTLLSRWDTGEHSGCHQRDSLPCSGTVPLGHPTFTAQCPFLQHTCDLVTVCPEHPTCPLWVIQPSCHLYFPTATRILFVGQTRLRHAPPASAHLPPAGPSPTTPVPPQTLSSLATTAAPSPASCCRLPLLTPCGTPRLRTATWGRKGYTHPLLHAVRPLKLNLISSSHRLREAALTTSFYRCKNRGSKRKTLACCRR